MTDAPESATSQRVESSDELRQLYRDPSPLALQKVLTELDPHCQSMIALSPFVCLATCTADGSLDISPRGDPPGSIKVLDKSTLLIPDRSGNNRLDTLTNLTHNPEIALIFLVPGIIETLRVSGRAQIIHNDPRLAACAIGNKIPTTGILVEVHKAFLQCGKAVMRGAIFEDRYRVARSDFPSFGKILVDQTGIDKAPEDLDAAIDQSYRDRLY